MTRAISLYLHIPFCRRRCRYCSFVSYQGREAAIPAYVSALKAELARRAGAERVTSVYFGGGTPSLLSPAQIGEILSDINALFVLEKGAEISIEANPGTVGKTYLASLKTLGINRLSLGVQSLDDAELARLGRLHTAAEAREAVELARSAGFTDLNLDLIYGLPGQSVAAWRRTLDEAAGMAPDHLSLYALSLEPETLLCKDIKEGRLPDIDPDLAADQYELAGDRLAASGYRQYEISNWARPGRECRHNLTYWRNRPYLGMGVAAHSCLNGRRFANTGSLDEYLAACSEGRPPVLDLDEAIGPDLALAESVILGLRLCDGVGLDDIRRRFGVDILSRYGRQVAELAGLGLLERDDGHIKLTRRGRLLSNEAFWRFLPENSGGS